MQGRGHSQETDLDVIGKTISGLQKAALLLIALDVDNASQVFRHLDPNDVEKITTEISQVKGVPSEIVTGVLEEYYQMITAREYVLEGGLDFAQQVLERSFGLAKAVEIIEKVKNMTTLRGFDVLKKADSAQLINFLNKEHPQTIALILSHLSPDQTAQALKELPDDLRSDVAFRIATLGKVSPQTLKQIESVVDELAGYTMNQTIGKVGGTRSLATILNRVNATMSKEIIKGIEDRDPDVGAEIKRLMFLFDDIVHIQDKDVQRILREVDRKDLAYSLKTADEKVRQKIFGNMSERAAELLKEELQYMGPVRLKEVESSQAKIVDVIKILEENGEIQVNMRGGTEDVYV